MIDIPQWVAVVLAIFASATVAGSMIIMLKMKQWFMATCLLILFVGLQILVDMTLRR